MSHPAYIVPAQFAALLRHAELHVSSEPDDRFTDGQVRRAAMALHESLGRRLSSSEDGDTLTVRLAPGLLNELHRLADERHCTVREYMRRAVALDRMVWDNHGGVLFVRGDDGGLLQVTALPPKAGTRREEGESRSVEAERS